DRAPSFTCESVPVRTELCRLQRLAIRRRSRRRPRLSGRDRAPCSPDPRQEYGRIGRRGPRPAATHQAPVFRFRSWNSATSALFLSCTASFFACIAALRSRKAITAAADAAMSSATSIATAARTRRAGQNAGSLCFNEEPSCVYGRGIVGVEGPRGTPIPLGTLDANTWLGTVNEQNEYNANGNPASNVFVAASEWGKGRVIGYAHDGLIRDAVHRNCYSSNDVARCEKTTPKTETADNLTFIDNALRWAMGPTPADCPTKTITIAIYEGWVKMPETQEIADLAKRRDWSYERIL